MGGRFHASHRGSRGGDGWKHAQAEQEHQLGSQVERGPPQQEMQENDRCDGCTRQRYGAEPGASVRHMSLSFRAAAQASAKSGYDARTWNNANQCSRGC